MNHENRLIREMAMRHRVYHNYLVANKFSTHDCEATMLSIKQFMAKNFIRMSSEARIAYLNNIIELFTDLPFNDIDCGYDSDD